jgi:dihydroorotate dehydrogenase electron transfer subunit
MELKVLFNRHMGDRYYHMRVGFSEALKEVSSGQFLMVRVLENTTDPLLLRPMSILRNDPTVGTAQMMYRAQGKGSSFLAKKKKDDPLEVLGPFGKGFTLSRETEKIYLVGGGIGVPPLIHFAESITGEGRDVNVFIGGQSAGDIIGEDDFIAAGAKVTVSTMDGSDGFRGLVTIPFRDEILGADPNDTMVYTCGPTGMMKRVAEICNELGIPCQLSMETAMGCGFGVCLGCAVLTRNPQGMEYVRACREGPVFFGGDLVLEAL